MRSCRGGTCLEYAIFLGLIGSVVIIMATFAFPKVELGRSRYTGHPGELCR